MRRSTTETKTNRAERPKEVTRDGNDRVTKTEVDVTKVMRNVGFYAGRPHSIWVLSPSSEVKLGTVPAAKRQALRDEMKKIIAELEKDKTVTNENSKRGTRKRTQRELVDHDRADTKRARIDHDRGPGQKGLKSQRLSEGRPKGIDNDTN